jgi:hypothetical protein
LFFASSVMVVLHLVGGCSLQLGHVRNLSVVVGRQGSSSGGVAGGSKQCGLEGTGDGLAGLAGTQRITDDDDLGVLQAEPVGKVVAAAGADLVVEEVTDPRGRERLAGPTTAGGAGVQQCGNQPAETKAVPGADGHDDQVDARSDAFNEPVLGGRAL